MKGCNYIRKQIDEADKPDLLSFEVTQHLAGCPDCERFADERSALRMLVASSARVSAPINFDAVLNARLAEVKSRRSFWWLGSPIYSRLGVAAAVLAVMFFAAQYAGLLSNQSKRSPKPVAVQNPMPAPDVSRGVPPALPPIVDPTPGKLQNSAAYATVSGARSRRGGGRPATPVYLTAEDGGVVLVRGQNGEMDVQMPTVSVGAQPLLYVRAGQRAVSNIGTSF